MDILATTTPAAATTTTNLNNNNNNAAVPPSSKLTPSSINSHHHHHLHNPLVLPSHHHHHHPHHKSSTKSSSRKVIKTSVPGTETVLIETSLDSESASESANSDNSSTDEGIDNPEDVVLDDEDEEDDENPDEVVLNLDQENPDGILSVGHHHHPHSHHEHHHNHHYQHLHHHRRHRNTSGCETVSSKTSSSAVESASETADFYTDDPEYQVERYLNGTSAKHYQDLKREESNLLKEIQEVEREQSTPKPPKEPKKSDENNEDDDEDDDDEELLEFQKIEREIKLSELRKCLQVIQKQIENCRVQMHKDEAEGVNKQSQNRPTSSAFDFVTSMTDSMLEECRLDAAAQVILSEEEESKSRAPLAVADEWDTESQITSYESIPTVSKPSSPTKPKVPPKPSLNGNLSDSDDSEDESPVAVLPSVPPKTPPRRESLKSNTSSTLAGPEAILFDRNEFYRQSLHEDALHESIEQSLQLVNSVSDADVERFVISTNTKPPIPSSNGSIIRRESQYENEQKHACGVTHRRGYELIQKSNKKLQNGSTESEQQQQQKSQSLDDLLGKPTEKDLDDELALRRRSAKFPNSIESSNLESANPESNGVNEVRKRNSDSSNTINGSNTNGNSRTSLASNSQRPLTLYLPSPNEELNLISHLHALGHDLTSSIVTNNLLLTPFTCSGYLYKQCAGSSTKWRKRYFHFNRVRKVFVYFHDRTAFEKRRHPKRGVFFDEIQDVYVDHTRINMKKFLSGQQSPSHLSHHSTNVSTASSSHTKADGNTRCVFVVATTTMNRKFILSTFSPELMRIWMDVIFTGANAYLQDYDNFDV